MKSSYVLNYEPHFRCQWHFLFYRVIELSTKREINFGADLKDQQHYVAVGNDKFKDFEYGMSVTMFSPKQQMAKYVYLSQLYLDILVTRDCNGPTVINRESSVFQRFKF